MKLKKVLALLLCAAVLFTACDSKSSNESKKKEKKAKKEKEEAVPEKPAKKLPKKRVRNIVILCISILAAILILSFFGGD